MISDQLYKKFYGEPGNPKYDGTLAFYSAIRSLARPDGHVLNLGAGPFSANRIKSLRGEVAWVAGADIDPIVLSNEELDAAFVIEDHRLPFDDGRFDLVFSDYVLEHVETPDLFLSEIYRVLKPGGSFLFRTPNLFHYVAMISYATPHWAHERLANRVRALPEGAHEPWPTFYRLNTRRSIRRAAERAGFLNIRLSMEEYQPAYLVFHPAAFLVGVAYERLVNSAEWLAGFRANIFGKLIK
jgi:SAM-dependent methyltransferase